MATKRIPRPRDPIALAKLVGDIATGQVEDRVEDGKDPASSALGRLGGLKGGKARAEKLSSERRTEIAQKSASRSLSWPSLGRPEPVELQRRRTMEANVRRNRRAGRGEPLPSNLLELLEEELSGRLLEIPETALLPAQPLPTRDHPIQRGGLPQKGEQI